MVIFNKCFSEVGRDLDFNFFFLFLPKMDTLVSPEREREIFKALCAYTPFPFEKDYKQLHLILQLKLAIMEKTGKQHDSTILTLKVFFERCSYFYHFQD